MFYVIVFVAELKFSVSNKTVSKVVKRLEESKDTTPKNIQQK